MKHHPLFFIIILALITTSATGQTDTLSVSAIHTRWVPLVGTTLLASGTLFSVQPELHRRSIEMRDALQIDGHSQLRFDDYAQFIPIATSAMLNICGVEGKHSLKRLSLLSGTSFLIGMTALEAGKYGFHVQRPNGHGFTSFPSGHTWFAFTVAEILRREYGADYPWIAVGGYIVAATIGFMRMYNNRHWFSDVVAGAGLGMLCVSVSYKLWGE